MSADIPRRGESAAGASAWDAPFESIFNKKSAHAKRRELMDSDQYLSCTNHYHCCEKMKKPSGSGKKSCGAYAPYGA